MESTISCTPANFRPHSSPNKTRKSLQYFASFSFYAGHFPLVIGSLYWWRLCRSRSRYISSEKNNDVTWTCRNIKSGGMTSLPFFLPRVIFIFFIKQRTYYSHSAYKFCTVFCSAWNRFCCECPSMSNTRATKISICFRIHYSHEKE